MRVAKRRMFVKGDRYEVRTASLSFVPLPQKLALLPSRQAASLYERAVNVEETAERHVLLGEALVLADRKSEALWHYGRAADLYEDRENKVGYV